MLFILAFATTFYLLIDEHVSNMVFKPHYCSTVLLGVCQDLRKTQIKRHFRVSIQGVIWSKLSVLWQTAYGISYFEHFFTKKL